MGFAIENPHSPETPWMGAHRPEQTVDMVGSHLVRPVPRLIPNRTPNMAPKNEGLVAISLNQRALCITQKKQCGVLLYRPICSEADTELHTEHDAED
jgi:hypothetical protein